MNGKYIIQCSQESVWAALNDPAVLEQCIPGCSSLAQLSDTEFDAEVVAKIGPVKAKFRTSVTLENMDAPNSYTLVGSSKAGAAGFGKGKADVTLRSVEEGTELSYVADFKVGGKLAQIGSRLVAGATKKTADDFFGNFSNLLGAQSQTTPTNEPVAPTQRLLKRLQPNGF